MYIAPDRYGIRLRVHEVYNIPRDKKKKEEKKERKSPLYLYGHTYSMSRDQPGKVADPSRGQLNREKFIFPCPRSCLRIWSRETGSVIPSRVSLLISIHRLNLVLTYGFLPSSAAASIYSFITATPSGQFRVYRVTQLRIDGVHCRESAGTVPVNLSVVPNECCLGRSPWTSDSTTLN